MKERRILVTAALPYANGHIHIGHLVEYIQTDIWVRFQKLRGHRCIYICADDTHGTAIMIRARQEGVSEEELIAEMQSAHVARFRRVRHRVRQLRQHHSPENRELCAEIWTVAARRRTWSVEKEVDAALRRRRQGRSWPTVSSRGPARSAGRPTSTATVATSAATRTRPTDLIDPVSTLSGTTPEVRTAPHLFIELEQLHGFLDEWTQSGDHLQPEMANYLKGHFLGEPLRDWDISRPAPYFGFEIPDSPGNYWYVWFDAPIGYMASTRQWCDRHGENFDDWWRQRRDRDSTISSARTSPISTRSSGRACSRRPVSACRPRSTSTAS